ncbi:hypothetical protein [Corynebacterium alimapuense]|uniref:Uncharacterized protein n=1 Tax=Corynebacterium alimapuense TaxID=1576874 RepID=A0A3M8K6F2_9CORY|nr:hypothetical protein [Corynebacterium alimapuense]RNE48801.1 hypothetical protein C5L39_05720 [Corynebacterium alimapuense]
MRAFISLILGGVILAAGYFWYLDVGEDVLGIVAALVMAVGGALIVTAVAIWLDVFSPTSRKLGK